MGEGLKSNKIGRGGTVIAVSCSSWNADCSLGSKDSTCAIVLVIFRMSLEASRFRSVEMYVDNVGRMRGDSDLSL